LGSSRFVSQIQRSIRALAGAAAMMRLVLIPCLLWTAAGKTPLAEGRGSLLGLRSVVDGARIKGSLELQSQMEAIALAPVTIGLMVTSLVVALCIVLLVIKYRKNVQKLEKLHARVRGLNHSEMLEQQKNSKDQEEIAALKAMLSKEEQMLAETGKALHDTESQVEAGNRELQAERARIATQKAEIKFLSAEDQALSNNIVKRGRVHVDLENKVFKFVEPIEFASSYITPDMTEAPPAAFKDDATARAIISDLAEVLKFVKKAIILVEGHTSGGDKAMSTIGYQIASERAEKVVETLVALGIDSKRLEAKGMPGLLGDNKADVKLKTLSWGL